MVVVGGGLVVVVVGGGLVVVVVGGVVGAGVEFVGVEEGGDGVVVVVVDEGVETLGGVEALAPVCEDEEFADSSCESDLAERRIA